MSSPLPAPGSASAPAQFSRGESVVITGGDGRAFFAEFVRSVENSEGGALVVVRFTRTRTDSVVKRESVARYAPVFAEGEEVKLHDLGEVPAHLAAR